MYQIEVVPLDVSRDIWLPMCNELKMRGYVVVGQNGGGDYGSALYFANPNLNPGHEEEIMQDHYEQMDRCMKAEQARMDLAPIR